jgi:hypothetical protein
MGLVDRQRRVNRGAAAMQGTEARLTRFSA